MSKTDKTYIGNLSLTGTAGMVGFASLLAQ